MLSNIIKLGGVNMSLSIRRIRSEDEMEAEEGIYSQSRDELVEDDEISIEEAGFMRGYMEEE